LTFCVVDASVLLASEDTDDANHAHAARLLEGSGPLATLDLALYEVTNVAVCAWRDGAAARRLGERIAALADDGGLVRIEASLMDSAAHIALEHGISVYDASYVAGARACGAQLVSCNVRDLVWRGLALLPVDALSG
jgi:predicted nucleic acid-binding protein